MTTQLKESDGMRMLFAGMASVCSGSATHPIEVVKTRMQIMGEAGSRSKIDYGGSFLSTAKVIAKNEGFAGFLKGIKATWMRESVYSTLRLGLYEPFKHLLGGTDRTNTAFHIKFFAGGLSGIVGSTIANPTDLLKIRMQATEHESRGIGWHVKDIYHSNGVLGFYKGLQATVVRAFMLNATKLATYDHIKHTLINSGILKDGYMLHFVSSLVAGVAMATATAPFDIARTRLMNQPNDRKLYTGLIDFFVKTVKHEGLLSLYKGFTPQWMRFGPFTTIQLMVWELLRNLYGMAGI
jgi:hypothetical protein